jgi:hypothetical protein
MYVYEQIKKFGTHERGKFGMTVWDDREDPSFHKYMNHKLEA